MQMEGSSVELAPTKEVYMRDIRANLAPIAVPMRTIYESFTPENTHLMREYMLHIMIKNVRRMRKHRLISESVFEKFSLLPDLGPPKN